MRNSPTLNNPSIRSSPLQLNNPSQNVQTNIHTLTQETSINRNRRRHLRTNPGTGTLQSNSHNTPKPTLQTPSHIKIQTRPKSNTTHQTQPKTPQIHRNLSIIPTNPCTNLLFNHHKIRISSAPYAMLPGLGLRFDRWGSTDSVGSITGLVNGSHQGVALLCTYISVYTFVSTNTLYSPLHSGKKRFPQAIIWRLVWWLWACYGG